MTTSLTEKLTGMDRNGLLDLLDLTDSIATDKENKLDIYQPNSEVITKFHASPARNRSIISGNRGGKTAALCVEAVIKATGIIPDSLKGIYPEKRLRVPSIVRICAVDYDNGVYKIVEPEVKKWLPKDIIAEQNKSMHVIKLKNGSVIEFMSYAQPIPKFGGTARDFVGYDEIPPPDVVKENVMRTIDRGGDQVYSFTPVLHERDDGRGITTNNALAIAHYYDNIYLKCRRMVDPHTDTINEDGFKWIEIFHIDVFENPHINTDVLLEEMQAMSKKDINVRVKGRFEHLAGLVYGQEYDESTQLARHYKHDPDWPVYVAIDCHPKVAHHVTYVSVNPRGEAFIVDEIQIQGTVGELASAMAAVESYKKYWVVWRLIDALSKTPDPITGSNFGRELAALGYPARIGSKDVYTGIYAVKDAFKGHKLFVCEDVIGHRWELAHYIWQGDKPIDRGDHFMENLRRIMILNPLYMDKKLYLLDTMGAPDAPMY